MHAALGYGEEGEHQSCGQFGVQGKQGTFASHARCGEMQRDAARCTEITAARAGEVFSVDLSYLSAPSLGGSGGSGCSGVALSCRVRCMHAYACIYTDVLGEL